MLFRNVRLKYYEQANDDGAGDGGQGSQGSQGGDDIEAIKKELESLKSHHEKLLSETKAAKAKAREEAEAKAKADEEAARKAGDVQALEKSWQEKYSKAESEWQGKYEQSQKHLNGLLVDSVAQKAASEIAVDPACGELLAEKIRAFLSVAERDGKAQTVVVDADGKPSALTVEELKKQIAEKYPRLVKGSPAGGAGGQDVKPGSGAAGGGNDMVLRAKEIINKHR